MITLKEKINQLPKNRQTRIKESATLHAAIPLHKFMREVRNNYTTYFSVPPDKEQIIRYVVATANDTYMQGRVYPLKSRHLQRLIEYLIKKIGDDLGRRR